MSETEAVTLSEVISNRASLYSLLARLYRVEVDRDLLEKLRLTKFETDLDNLDIAEGHRLWNDFMGKCGETTLTDLAVDYVHAFIGTSKGSSGAAYPFESVYTSKRRLLMQEARDQVVDVYRTEGLGTKTDFNEPEDHIAVELEFMAFLCHKTADALDKGEIEAALEYLRKQQSFIRDHLERWVPRFCSDVSKFARSEFYKGLAKVTTGHLTIENQAIPALMESLA